MLSVQENLPGAERMSYAIMLSVTIIVSASLVVLGSLAIIMGAMRPRPANDGALGQADAEIVFLFRDEELVDCSDPARQLLDTLEQEPDAPHMASALTRLMRHLAPRFPDIGEQMAQLGKRGHLTLHSVEEEAGLVLTAQFNKGLARLTLSDTQAEGSLVAIDRLSYDTLNSEVETLRHATRHVPALIWQTDRLGNVVWANASYIAQLQSADSGAVLTWPLPDLFAGAANTGEDTGADKGVERLSIETQGATYWFAHTQVALGARVMHFAAPIDLAVQSEAARSETLQTLTRTFASLQIGLALFDAERRLQVFNPALVDMTGLNPMFLAARPSFEQVLYALREARMLPEPKDFNNWRREIIEMERAAESGEYAQEWCLEGGRTFHVTGRPQPNGAIALFIEDVTSEAALSRSFRSEIETMHTVLDGLSEGIITFSLSGQTLLANDAYTALWQTDPCRTLADEGLAQAIRLWSAHCEPTTFWARLADFASGTGGRARITTSIARKQGGPVTVSAQRLRGGNLMVVFQPPDLALRPAMGLSQAEIALQSGLIQRPDMASVTHDAVPEAASDAPARKPRSARHAGTRLRA